MAKTHAKTLNYFVAAVLRRFVAPYFLNASCVVRNPVEGKLALAESELFRLVTGNLHYHHYKSVIAAAALNNTWKKEKEPALLKSLRAAIKNGKYVGRGASLTVKRRQAEERAMREKVRSFF